MPQPNTKTKLIFRVAIALPIFRLFDYSVPDDIDPNNFSPGIRLLVPFGKGKKIAYLVEIIDHTEAVSTPLKTVEQILDKKPLLQKQDMALLQWASRYYHYPLGEVINAAFPSGLRKGKNATLKPEKKYQLTEQGLYIDLTTLDRAPRQQALLKKFRAENGLLNNRQLFNWNRNYASALRALIGKNLIETCSRPTSSGPNRYLRQQPLIANRQQQQAIDCVIEALGHFRVFLLEGVTGSGKTEVYMQIINKVLEQGQQVMILLPEITLTPQLQQRFSERFRQPIAVFHSALSATDRQNAWLNIQQGNSAILLGTRSALFTPFHNLGLIILDEEHDSSFKQQEGFRFSARDVAVVRARNQQIPIVLGSATPSLESLYNVMQKRYQLLHLPERAGNASSPDFILLDIRNKKMHDGLSIQLITEIKKTLARQEQVLLFFNRRGYAPVLICHACGWVARCRRCDANLVIHDNDQKLRCHHCAAEQGLFRQCPNCAKNPLTPLGMGTEKIEKTLHEFFPDEKIIRLDRDTTRRKGVLEKFLREIHDNKTHIILGTQMLAKGHHFPNVTLVALLDVDRGLFSIDFHATEKLAQLIVQVAGRAGRSEKPGKVILQTRQPDHVLLHGMIKGDYRNVARALLQERKHAALPPYSYQALLRVWAHDAQSPHDFLDKVRERIENGQNNLALVLGPVPSPMARRAGKYRYQMLLQSPKRKNIQHLLDWLVPELKTIQGSGKVRWSVDIDPIDLY